MERIVEDKWVALETETPIEFAKDEWEIVSLFSRKLNVIAYESSIQERRDTIKQWEEMGKGKKYSSPKHSGNMLFPGDIVYTYRYCLKADEPVYIVFSNLCIQHVTRGSYEWKRSLEQYIRYTEQGSVRGFYEYRNEKDGDTIACMRELSLEEITEIINEGDEE